MSKAVKGFFCGIALVSLTVMTTACPKKPKPVTHPEPTSTSTQSAAPTITMPPADNTVTKNDDFVKTDTQPAVKEEVMPSNLEDLNNYVQQRGLVHDAFFNYAESTLSADAQSALQSSATWLKGDGRAYNLLIEGHCDERGTEQYNLALGDRRANTVKEYLATLGVDAGRMRTVSYGEERPFDPGHDESAWAKNRRAHLVIVGK